jgi:hypothetical protein
MPYECIRERTRGQHYRQRSYRIPPFQGLRRPETRSTIDPWAANSRAGPQPWIIDAALGNRITTPMWDGWCAGNTQWPVHGWPRATRQLSTAAAGWDGRAHLWKQRSERPVVEAKRRIIESGRLMVYRLGSAWDQFRPAAQSHAPPAALGLTPQIMSPAERARCGVRPVRTTVAALAQTAADRLRFAARAWSATPVCTSAARRLWHVRQRIAFKWRWNFGLIFNEWVL